MSRTTLAAILLSTLLGIVPAASAADRSVRLENPQPLRENLAAMPQIADPADDAERRINTALKRLDGNVRKAIRGCKGSDWTRTVEAPMTGPGFLSLTVADTLFCEGAAHPESGLYAIVYDLTTGKPVDWAQLLPAKLVGKQALEEQDDGTRIVTLSSQRLYQLYLAGYTGGSAAGDDLAECQQAIALQAADAPPAMMVWLDAGQGGLAAEISLPHVVAACEQAVIIPAQTLRADGASPVLLKALQAARRD